jgi:hypothetical protein
MRSRSLAFEDFSLVISMLSACKAGTSEYYRLPPKAETARLNSTTRMSRGNCTVREHACSNLAELSPPTQAWPDKGVIDLQSRENTVRRLADVTTG